MAYHDLARRDHQKRRGAGSIFYAEGSLEDCTKFDVRESVDFYPPMYIGERADSYRALYVAESADSHPCMQARADSFLGVESNGLASASAAVMDHPFGSVRPLIPMHGARANIATVDNLHPKDKEHFQPCITFDSERATRRNSNLDTPTFVSSSMLDEKRISMMKKNDVIDSAESTEENGGTTSESSVSYPSVVTTLMVCNLPSKVTQESLAQVIDDMGFATLYDLVYIPKGMKTSTGYGFINFITSQAASEFSIAFESFSFPGNSSKRAYAQVARTQGLTDTLASILRGGNFRKRGQTPLLFNSAASVLDHEFAVGPGGVFL